MKEERLGTCGCGGVFLLVREKSESNENFDQTVTDFYYRCMGCSRWVGPDE